jgi:hypothetical protein
MRESVENPMVTNVTFNENKVVAKCTKCKKGLSLDDRFMKFLGEYFCDEDCIFDYHELEIVEGNEIE